MTMTKIQKRRKRLAVYYTLEEVIGTLAVAAGLAVLIAGVLDGR